MRAARKASSGRLMRARGIATSRQQPETAKGTILVSLEDETGTVQVFCWRCARERQRAALLQARMLAVYGTWERESEAGNLPAGASSTSSRLQFPPRRNARR
jgi:error-prone DNA polymerase